MSRSRMFFALFSIFAVLATVGCGNQELQDEVAALNERVASLEGQIQSLNRAAPSPQLENEAKSALGQITQLAAAGKIDEAKAKLKADQAKYASTKAARSFQSLARELAVYGKDSPKDWGIEKWFQGESSIDLASNATTVVVFWETWCPHCRREVPKLQEMYTEYKDDGLQLIGVTKLSKSSTEATVNEFIAQNKLSYPIAKENGSLSRHFAVSGIPAAAVVKNGKVVWRGHPVRLTDAMLKDWLAS